MKLGFTSLLSVMSGLSSLEKVWLAGPCGLRGIDTGREYGRQHNYRCSSEHKAVWGVPKISLAFDNSLEGLKEAQDICYAHGYHLLE